MYKEIITREVYENGKLVQSDRKVNTDMPSLDGTTKGGVRMGVGLKPCPFCGGKNIIVDTDLVIECKTDVEEAWYEACCDFRKGGCGARSGTRKTPEEAIKAWNRRVESV